MHTRSGNRLYALVDVLLYFENIWRQGNRYRYPGSPGNLATWDVLLKKGKIGVVTPLCLKYFRYTSLGVFASCRAPATRRSRKINFMINLNQPFLPMTRRFASISGTLISTNHFSGFVTSCDRAQLTAILMAIKEFLYLITPHQTLAGPWLPSNKIFSTNTRIEMGYYNIIDSSSIRQVVAMNAEILYLPCLFSCIGSFLSGFSLVLICINISSESTC